ncbi:hypothetical protein [Geobacillus stearothermophilus]|uniref:hypothetical protein n=1 Tax=Geobacillus stearothermophilus TaxID=1422 RepID=UPI003D227F20
MELILPSVSTAARSIICLRLAWAGQAIGLIHDIPSVAELFARMIGEAEQIRRRWAN